MNSLSRYDFFGARSGKNSVVEETVNFPLHEKWRAEGLLSERITLFVSEELVVAVTEGPIKKLLIDSKIAAYARETGHFLWEYRVDMNDLELWGGGTCLYKDIVITCLGGWKSNLRAIRNGEVIWHTTEFESVRVIGHYDGEIILNTYYGICFIEPETGKLIRRYDMLLANSGTFNEQLVIAISQEKDILNCFDRKTGELLWRSSLRNPKKGKHLGSIACRAPLIIGDRYYAATGGSSIACFNALTGEFLWVNTDANLNAVLYRDGLLYGVGYGYYCLDAATGVTVRGIKQYDMEYSINLPYMAGKYLFCTGKRLVAINTDTGEEVWVKEDKRKTHYFGGQPIFLDGCLYTADNKGNLYCFEIP